MTDFQKFSNLLIDIIMLLLLIPLLVDPVFSIFLSAYNVRQFGVSKMGKPLVVEQLIKIFRRYDLVLMQEIQDVSNTKLWEFLNQTNSGLKPEEQYLAVASERVGRGSKEQYAYFYKPAKLRLIKAFTPNDTFDWFSREPYGAIFEDKVHPNKLNFFVYGLHDKPDDAYKEILHFLDIYLYVVNGSNPYPLTPAERNIIREYALLMGDLNCGGTYVGKTKEEGLISYYNSKGMHWLIDRETDTMVKTDNAYDRFISTTKFKEKVKLSSVRALNVTFFKNDVVFADECSDHYPIEMVFNEYIPTPGVYVPPVEDSGVTVLTISIVLCTFLCTLLM